jgi:transposase-like protein
MMDNIACQTSAGVQCPRCGCEAVGRHGRSASRKQRYQCRCCGKTFVIDPDVGVKPLVEEIVVNLIKAGVAVPVIHSAVRGHASRSWLYKRKRELMA